jgi:hypothetical protein
VKKPLCIDLFAGCSGWGEGFVAEGFRVVGFDIVHEPYHGEVPDGCTLVLQDVLTLNGAQFKNATCIMASPPCQEYSYRAMPWKRAKALPPPGNELFDACFRIQREACEAAGRYIPMVVENVNGAQRWVGRAVSHYGSQYLWGDVPALLPVSVETKGFRRRFENTPMAWHSSRSHARKAASAQIARIPFALANHIAKCFKPRESEVAA